MYIKEPRSQDVLCGRGRPIREHKGNIRYNKMIQDMRQEYEDAPNGRKLEVVKKLIDTIRADHGRFLHKKGENWLELEPEKVIVKTSQAFRDLRTDDSNQANANVHSNASSQSNRASKKFDYNDLKKRAPAGRFASLLHRRRESPSTLLAGPSTSSSPSSTPSPSPSPSDTTSGDDDGDKATNSNTHPNVKETQGSKSQSECDDSETESEHSFPPIHL
jgi:hypothetical protein